MPHMCCVPKCRSNYVKSDKSHSVFSFPSNEELKKKWLTAIKRQNFSLTKYSRVCELHFKPEDIERSTKFYSATGDVYDVPLKHPRLKSDVVPSIFPNLPKYFSKEGGCSRESPNSKRLRLENEALRHAIQESIETSNEHLQMQSLVTLNDVVDKFKNKHLPSWTLTRTKNYVSFLRVLEKPQPVVDYVATIGADMQLTLFSKDVEVKSLITASGNLKFPVSVQSCNFLEDILIKINEKLEKVEWTVKEKIDMVVNILESMKEQIPEKTSSLNFFQEQVGLIKNYKNKSAIRYSWETVLFCSLFHAISPHAYKFVANYNLLILPCTNTVKKVCNNSLTDPRLEQSKQGFLKYIQLKVPLLTDKDKLVTLMVDEVHLKPYMDYKGGNLVGGAFNSEACATSACTFMINSLLSSYTDVVHVAPVKTLNGKDLHEFKKRVICGLETLGFEVLVTVTDNHRVNRSAMSLFADPPAITNEYPHPNDCEKPLFYSVDSVHIIKNIKNNWLNREPYEFLYPDFNDFTIKRRACFSTLREMHKKEENQLLKYGYTISKKALYPTSIEKQNVKLTLQVFNNTTAVALKEFGPKAALYCYEDTASFIEIISTWWDIANVKTYFKGIRNRNKFQEPFKKESHHIFEFLNKFLAWLDEWEKFDFGTLTKDTHVALRLTTEAFLKIAHYCFTKKNLDYILPGKIQNDPIEGRFGKYRSLAGSQYLISLRQLYEVEKKLRLMSLVPLIIESKTGQVKITKEDISSFISYGKDKSNITNFEVNPVLKNVAEIEEGDIDNIHENIWPSLVYIAGYASHSLIKQINCAYCKEYLVNSAENLHYNDSTSYQTNLISANDRGGLCYPKDDVVLCAALAYLTVEKLLTKTSIFLKEENHREIVTVLTFENINDLNQNLFLGHNCHGHNTDFLIKEMLFKFANLLLKNFAKKRNDIVTSKNPIMPQLKRLNPGKKK